MNLPLPRGPQPPVYAAHFGSACDNTVQCHCFFLLNHFQTDIAIQYTLPPSNSVLYEQWDRFEQGLIFRSKALRTMDWKKFSLRIITFSRANYNMRLNYKFYQFVLHIII